MEISKTQIKKAGIKFIDLAAALGISPPMISQIKPDEPMPAKYQYALRFGSKEAQAIRRKTLRWIKKNEE